MKSIASTHLDVPFTFEKRPDPLPGEMRPKWRIATLLIILDISRGKKASLRKLHVLNWVIRNSDSRERFAGYVRGELSRTKIIIRVDPGLNHAIELARAEGLVKIISGKILLTKKGQTLVQEIQAQLDILVDEKEFAQIVKPYIQESKIDELLDWKDML